MIETLSQDLLKLIEQRTSATISSGESWSNLPMLGFDLETTGVDPTHDVPVSAALVYFVSEAQYYYEYFLINPGRKIPPEATAIHSITDEMVEEQGIGLKSALEKIVSIFNLASSSNIPIVGMNVSYDLTIVESQLRLLGLPPISKLDLKVLDVLTIDRHFDKYRKGNRKLASLCANYNVSLTDAHNAFGDALAALCILTRQIERFPLIGENTIESLLVDQAAWHKEWAEGFSKWLVSKGKQPLTPREILWPYCIG